jgi:hypothetical protein
MIHVPVLWLGQSAVIKSAIFLVRTLRFRTDIKVRKCGIIDCGLMRCADLVTVDCLHRYVCH